MSSYNDPEIMSILKHRYPLLMIDGIDEIRPMEMCEAYKRVKKDDWFFKAHFPDDPVMPGSLQLEAFSQAVALPLLIGRKNSDVPGFPLMLVAIDRARFHDRILPGNVFKIRVNILKVSMGMATAVAFGFVERVKVSECQITYKISEALQ
jgi:3-hydroxyacyl-[acyl-carrier-protein] dehydratase